MAKKVAVLAVNPVNGFGLFQYLEAFFENGISYKVYAVAETKEIKTNSGIELVADDVIANLKGKRISSTRWFLPAAMLCPFFNSMLRSLITSI